MVNSETFGLYPVFIKYTFYSFPLLLNEAKLYNSATQAIWRGRRNDADSRNYRLAQTNPQIKNTNFL